MPTNSEIAELSKMADWLQTPAPKGWLAGRITGLLGHHFVSGDGKLNESKIRDYVKILGEYPAWAVEMACLEYLANSDKPPKPASIKELVDKKMGIITCAKYRIGVWTDQPKAIEHSQPKTRMMQRFEQYKQGLPHGPDDVPRHKPTVKQSRAPEEIARVDAALADWKKAYSEAQAEKAERGTEASEFVKQVLEKQRLPRGEAIRRAMGLKQPREGE